MNDRNDFPIQIDGISEFSCKNLKSFSELNIQESVIISSIEDITHILRVTVSSEINKVNTCPMFKGVNCEGQVFTGSRLNVEGKILFKISYISNSESSNLCNEELYIPFCSYIILEDKSAILSNYSVTCFIEDVYLKLKSKRKIFYSILVCIHAEQLS